MMNDYSHPSRAAVAGGGGLDLLRLPLIGSFLRWRFARLSLQLTLGALALVIVLHGLLGPTLAPKNLATLLTWVHYRGLLVIALLAVGNLFCMGCPLLLPRSLARRFFQPLRSFPRALRNKWIAVATFVGVLFAYEAWDLWGDPRWTAALVLGLFGAALAVDASFRGAPFCKFVCPIGQFSFLTSVLSPFEVRAKSPEACSACATKDCIRGERAELEPARVVKRGCELALFVPQKVGNLDCTFCLDCVQACPHDNIAIAARVPGDELRVDPVRSGLGRLSLRTDYAALVVLFTFGALLNAFGMVGPVYGLQRSIAEVIGTKNEVLVLAVLFCVGLVVVPVVCLGITGWCSLRLGRSDEPLLVHLRRMAWSLLPLGAGVWAAHYMFHFLTGLWTFVPVTQNALVELGLPLLGTPDWGRGGLHAGLVQPLELCFLGLGLIGSVGVGASVKPRRTSLLPWIALYLLLFAVSVWLMQQPMEMRGTFL